MTNPRAFDIPDHLLQPAERSRLPAWIVLQNWRGHTVRVRLDAIVAYVPGDGPEQGLTVYIRDKESPLYATAEQAEMLDRLFQPQEIR